MTAGSNQNGNNPDRGKFSSSTVKITRRKQAINRSITKFKSAAPHNGVASLETDEIQTNEFVVERQSQSQLLEESSPSGTSVANNKIPGSSISPTVRNASPPFKLKHNRFKTNDGESQRGV